MERSQSIFLGNPSFHREVVCTCQDFRVTSIIILASQVIRTVKNIKKVLDWNGVHMRKLKSESIVQDHQGAKRLLCTKAEQRNLIFLINQENGTPFFFFLIDTSMVEADAQFSSDKQLT